jgi:thioredoxin 1
MKSLIITTILLLTLLCPILTSAAENEKVLLIFSATWCKYCKNAQNDMNFNDKTLSDLVKNYKIIDINIDHDKEITKGYGIKTIPAFVIYENGKEIKRQIGYKNSNQLINFLK